MDRQIVRFSGFEVNLHSRELRKAGVRVRLQEQPFQILAMLLERAGEVVSREDICERLWPNGTFVDFEHSVNAAIKRLRATLGDTAENPRFVETLHRRGYRFVAPIDQTTIAPPPPDVATRVPGVDRRPRLVVLPFTNLSDDRVPDYFSDGLTEEMIAQVGRLCASRIGVLARTSSMLYKNVGRTASDIGEALRADYLVEGSVRREGDRVRITAQLIETRGETHLWAESYDRRLSDCLAVQTEVASQIAHAMTKELLPTPHDARQTNPAAYEAFLRGRFHWNRPGPQGLEEAVASYDEATRLDPQLTKAFSARARARISLCDYYMAEPRAAMELARADAERALALDSGDAEGHLALGEVRRVLDWDWEGAETAYLCALTSNQSCDAAYRCYSMFLAARGRAEAAEIVDRACDLDPLCLTAATAAATIRYFRGDYETALDRYQRPLRMDPLYAPARRGMAAALVQLGRFDEAIDQLASLPEARLDPVSRAWLGHALASKGNKTAAEQIAVALLNTALRQFVPAYHLALLYAGLENLDMAFAQLERACEARDPSLDTLVVEPRFWLLRGDARYARLLERMRLNQRPAPVGVGL